jgi:hypothetical protein
MSARRFESKRFEFDFDRNSPGHIISTEACDIKQPENVDPVDGSIMTNALTIGMEDCVDLEHKLPNLDNLGDNN